MILTSNKVLEGVVLEYDRQDNPQRAFESYTAVDTNRKGAVEYVVGQCVEHVEKSIVTSPTDPLYQASSTIAKQLISSRTAGSVLALGFYYLIKNVSSNKESGK
jgi:hypothetical protein